MTPAEIHNRYRMRPRLPLGATSIRIHTYGRNEERAWPVPVSTASATRRYPVGGYVRGEPEEEKKPGICPDPQGPHAKPAGNMKHLQAGCGRVVTHYTFPDRRTSKRGRFLDAGMAGAWFQSHPTRRHR